MGIRVAGGGKDGRATLLGHRQEVVGMGGSVHGIQGDAQAAAGGVLEAHRAGQTGGEFPVALALGGAGADGPPTDEVGDVLGADEIEKLGPRRHPQTVDVHQQGAGQLEALVDLEAAVQVRVIDQPLPAHGGAWLLEVDAHDDQQVLVQAVAHRAQALGVVPRGGDVMDRAGADDHEQAVILVVKDVADRPPGVMDGGGDGIRQRVEADQVLRRDQLLHGADAQVVGLVTHGSLVNGGARSRKGLGSTGVGTWPRDPVASRAFYTHRHPICLVPEWR